MSLNLEISLEDDIKRLDEFFTKVKFKAVTLATRQALNRTAQRSRSLAVKEIAKRKKLKQKEIRSRVPMRRARGMNIATLESSIFFSGLSLPLILFILGQKTPKPQVTTNARRKPRRFEITRGKKQKKPGLFIQRANRGKMQFQVFQRRNPSSKSNRRYAQQSAPGLSEFLQKKRSVLSRIENHSIAIMQLEFDRAVEFQLNKLK